jgi:hypothetical protein
MPSGWENVFLSEAIDLYQQQLNIKASRHEKFKKKKKKLKNN